MVYHSVIERCESFDRPQADDCVGCSVGLTAQPVQLSSSNRHIQAMSSILRDRPRPYEYRTSDSAAPTPARQDRSAELKAAQMRILDRHTPLNLLAQIPLSLLVLFVFWNAVSATLLLSWALALWLTVAVRTLTYRGYIGGMPSTERTARAALIGSLSAGVIWGSLVPLVYLPEAVPEAWFVVLILAGIAAGSASTLTAHMPAFYGFSLPITSSCTLILLSQPGSTYGAIGVAILVFTLFLLMVARNNHRALIESLNLRFENLELVQALSEKKEEAERANLAKSKFLAAASHDLRQPLHALSLFSGALKERIRDPEQADIVDKLRTSVGAMEGLFDALLDISRLDAGLLEKNISSFPVQPLLDEIALECAPIAQCKGLRFKTMPSSLRLRSDPALLSRIVRNFATNALRYTDKGGVLIGCRRGGKSARICVVDTGPGIPAQRHEEIFEEFMQLSNPERDRSKGLGLGLAIVRRLAQILEHPVTLKSQPGRGSVFAVEVTLGTAAEMDRNQPTEVTSGEDRSAGFIIVIDDETLLLDGFRVLLEGWGHAVLTARSGAEILDKLMEFEQVPVMIICDYRLRDEETGIEVIRQLREEFNEDIPAILITGDTARNRLLDAKAHSFRLVHKPVNTEELRTLIDTALVAKS